MSFQIYTSTFRSHTSSDYIIAEEQLWDNQKLVFSSNSLTSIEKVFQQRLRTVWRDNDVFFSLPKDGTRLVPYEIHCKVHKNLRIKPPVFKDEQILFKNVPRTYRTGPTKSCCIRDEFCYSDEDDDY